MSRMMLALKCRTQEMEKNIRQGLANNIICHQDYKRVKEYAKNMDPDFSKFLEKFVWKLCVEELGSEPERDACRDDPDLKLMDPNVWIPHVELFYLWMQKNYPIVMYL